MTPKDSAPLFTYTLTPREIPVGGSQPVTLTISVANETGEEQPCKQIAFTLPPQLREGSISLSTTSDTWAISPGGEPGLYVAQPQGATIGLGAKERIGFVFGGVQPSATPGGVSIDFVENAGEDRQGQLDATLVQGGPAITKFTADFLYVAPEAKVTFSWGTEGADKVMLDWGEGSHSGDPSGKWTVEPKATIVATLTAFASGGAKRTAQLTVTVGRPQVLSFDVEPQYVMPGAEVTLSWRTLFAQRCRLQFHPTVAKKGETLGDVPPNADGYRQTVDRSGTFNLRAINGTNTDSKSQPVTACVAPLVTSLTVDCSNWLQPRLSWTARGAVSATLTNHMGPSPGSVTPIDPESGSTSNSFHLGCELTFVSASHGVATVSIAGWAAEGVSWSYWLESPQGLNSPGGSMLVAWRGAGRIEGEVVPTRDWAIPFAAEDGSVGFQLPQSPPVGDLLWTGELHHRVDSRTLDAGGSWKVHTNTMNPPSMLGDQEVEP